MNTLSIKECLSFGWETVKARPWFFIGIQALIFFISIATHSLSPGPEHHYPFILTFTNNIVTGAISLLLSMGVTMLFLKAHDAPATATVHDLWAPTQFWNYLLLQLIVGALLIVGFVLLLVPGIFLALIFMFANYVLLEQKLTPIEAMKESARLTKGKRWQLLLFGLTLIGLNILGALLLVVGLLITVPVSMLATIHAYRILSKKEDELTVTPLTNENETLPTAEVSE